jgi:hypothetical protein
MSRALIELGTTRTAELWTRAVAAAFPNGLPDSPAAIFELDYDFDLEALDKLDQEFYQSACSVELTNRRYDYVLRHAAESGITKQ